jgi:hypothetical protein
MENHHLVSGGHLPGQENRSLVSGGGVICLKTKYIYQIGYL